MGLVERFEAHLLTLVVFWPAAAALFLLGLEIVAGALRGAPTRLSDRLWRGWALLASLVGLALAAEVWRRFDPAASGPQLVEHVAWLGDWGVNYYVGVDGLSLLPLALASFLLPLALLGSWTDARPREASLLLLSLQSGLLGAFASLNALLFYAFGEALLVPLFALIALRGGPRHARAALKTYLFGALGSALLLLGIVLLAAQHQQQFGAWVFDFTARGDQPGLVDTPIPAHGSPWWAGQRALFAALALAFGSRLALFPMHSWFLGAQAAAPTGAALLLCAVGLKLGGYGLLRYALPVLPDAALAWAPWMRALGVAGVLYGALLALAATDLRRLVACLSLCSAGLVVLGIFALGPSGVEGALLQLVHHGLWSAALLLLADALDRRRLGAHAQGLARPMPLFSVVLAVAALSALGLPGLGGFAADLLVLLGAFGRAPLLGSLALLGALLAAAALLGTLRRVCFGPLSPDAPEGLTDLGLRERVLGLALALPLLWIGVRPMTLLNPVDRSVNDLLEWVTARGGEASVGDESTGRSEARGGETP
jgi:NADH-quinone oxidoreductase subunit M